MYCKGFIKGFNHGFQYCSNAMGSSCLLNGTCQRNNNETGFKEETRSICAVFCEVEPNEHVSEPGGIEGPPKLPARFGGPILRYQLQRTLTLSRGKAAALLKNNSCTSYGFMEQAASVPCCRWDPCQSMPIHAILGACLWWGASGAGEALPSPRAPGGLPDVFRSKRHRGFVGHRSLCDVLRAAEHRHGTLWPWWKR